MTRVFPSSRQDVIISSPERITKKDFNSIDDKPFFHIRIPMHMLIHIEIIHGFINAIHDKKEMSKQST